LGEVDRAKVTEVAELMDWLAGQEALGQVAPLVAVEPAVLNTALNEVRWAPDDVKAQVALSAEEGDVVTVDEPGRVVWVDLWGGGSSHWAVAEGLLTLDMDKGEIRLVPADSEEGGEPLARLELAPWMASLVGVEGSSVPAEKLTLRGEGMTLKAVELTFWVGEDQKAPTRLRGAIILDK
jgi:hypothetical protein